MRLVPIECVKPGSFLGKNLYDKDGSLILKSEVLLTNNLLNKLIDKNISKIYIKDLYSDLHINYLIIPDICKKSSNIINETFCDENISKLANDILKDLTDNKTVMTALLDIKNMDDYTYNHSVRVAIFSLILGIALNLQKEDLKELFIGSILHDIGKVFVPKYIISKKGPLTTDEFKIIKDHPSKGYDYLLQLDNIPHRSKLIALQHHEKVNGLGYPYGLNASKIDLLAKIVCIADVYDALTSNRSYRSPLYASDALHYIIQNTNKLFDSKLATTFSNVMVPYPYGTIVELSNGDIGLVQKTFLNHPLRPTIKVLQSINKINEVGSIIKLINNLDISITRVKHIIQ